MDHPVPTQEGSAVITRTIFAVLFFMSFSQPYATAQGIYVPLLSGQVFVDGRPIQQIVEVRLEAHNSSLIATAHTFGSSRFEFRGIALSTIDESYYLTVKNPEFKELRHELYRQDFFSDSASPSTYHFGALIILNLERIPSDKNAANKRLAGSKTIDARQLKTVIPDEAQREYKMALENFATGDASVSIAHLEKAIALAPQYYDALNKLGSEYIKAGQYRKAENVLNRAQAINPNDPLPLINLGTLCFEESNRIESATDGDPASRAAAVEASYRKAVEFFDKALLLNPLDPRTNFSLGTALYKAGSYERAESILTHALTLDDKMHDARLTLVNLYTRQKRHKDALKQLLTYLEANPGSPQRKQLEIIKAQIENALSK